MKKIYVLDPEVGSSNFSLPGKFSELPLVFTNKAIAIKFAKDAYKASMEADNQDEEDIRENLADYDPVNDGDIVESELISSDADLSELLDQNRIKISRALNKLTIDERKLLGLPERA